MRNAGKIMIVVAAALSLGACANNQEPSSYPPGDGPSYPAPEPAGVSSAPSTAPSSESNRRECTAEDVQVSGDFGKKPTITIPDTCTAPTTLVTKDLKAGSGAEAKAGSAVQVDYDLVAWSDKQGKDSSFDSGQPFSVTVGAGEVIKGWDQGLVGIKQGARRLLIVPPDLGYGSQASGPLKANETLVFVVDAVKVG